MNSKIGFALIGCGAAGKIHALAMRQSDCVDLRWVVDCELRAAESLGQRIGAAWTTEIDRMLEDSAIEAVSLAVPHHLHLELASRVARAGKHILLEKPFTLDVQQARELVNTCEECRVVIAPWLERRFLPYTEHVRQIIADGSLGNIVYTRVCTLGYKPRAYWAHGMRFEEYPSTWRGQRATSGGGVLIMNAIHQIDLMMYLTGLSVTNVTAFKGTLHHEVEVEDLVVACLQYDSGALGMIEASCCTYGMGEFPIEGPRDAIMGTDGHLQLGSVVSSFDRIRFARTLEFPKLSVTDQKIKQLENFARHLREGVELRCRPQDAMRALAVVQAAYRSADSGTPAVCET